MDRETFKKQLTFAGERKPSMLRRCLDHDYQGRCIYLITLVTEGRQSLFGELTGKSDAILGSDDEPRIVLSPLGKEVQDLFYNIPQWHQEIQPIAIQMMPDHLHGILFVKEEMDKHLGQVISGYKAGCNKAYRRLSWKMTSRVLWRRHNILNSNKPSLGNDRRGRLIIATRGCYLPVATMTGCCCELDNLTAGSITWPTILADCWPKGNIPICSGYSLA